MDENSGFFDSILDRRILTKNMNFSPKISLYFWTNFSKKIFFSKVNKRSTKDFFRKKMYKMLNGCSFTSPTTPTTPQPSPMSHINFWNFELLKKCKSSMPYSSLFLTSKKTTFLVNTPSKIRERVFGSYSSTKWKLEWYRCVQQP